ncbi:MAG: hypothetical protein MASP_01765 [Candidatus Methanolliviera sp. GoM_asphalt]|nr:MAG: hypothetical protein MASP_01765 [Candidatus Methanolliviera sp. GoM_asphalt]
MSDNKVRFSAFVQEQKPSVQKMRVVRVLSRFDMVKGEVYVKDPRAFKDHLNDILFKHSLGLNLSRRNERGNM